LHIVQKAFYLVYAFSILAAEVVAFQLLTQHKHSHAAQFAQRHGDFYAVYCSDTSLLVSSRAC
jgi:hypothetical protein